MMKKNIIIILITFSVIVAIFCTIKNGEQFSEYRTDENEDAQREQKTNVIQDKAHGRVKTKELSKKVIQRLELLKRAWKFELNEQHEGDMEEIPELTSEITKEETEYRSKLFEQTNDVFFEQAPQILEEMMQAERMDIHWKANVERSVKRLLDNERIIGTELEETDCRMSLCKVKLVTPGEKELIDFQSLWSTLGPPSGNSFIQQGENENRENSITVYFTREESTEPFIKTRERIAQMMNDGEI